MPQQAGDKIRPKYASPKDEKGRWQPTQDPAWILEQEGFDPSQERQMESLFAIGNGYLGVRGASDFLIPASQADLFVAGVYDKKAENNPYSEPEFLANKQRDNPYSEIVPFPLPFRVEIHLDGVPLGLIGPELVQHSRLLDMRQGLYFQNFTFSDRESRKFTVKTVRCASRPDPNLLMQQIEIFSENYMGTIETRISMIPQEEKLAYPHLRSLVIGDAKSIAELHFYETSASGFQCCFAGRLSIDGIEKSTAANTITIAPGQTVLIRKYVSVFANSRANSAKNSVLEQALEHVAKRDWQDFDKAIVAHAEKWQEFWDSADIDFIESPEITHAQRFNLYHLNTPTRPDLKTSIGARALTGRAYEGHVFWDTEIFMLPFYLYTNPDIARDLLLYRYNTLGGARNRATAMGYSGACYAWESTLTGEDVTPHSIVIKGTNKEIPIFTGEQQIHVTADVAYSVWRYWNATLDEDFLVHFGAEILIETARFWATRVESDGTRFHINKVVGPDEYHSSVNDNAYTNWMARFNLEKAIWAYEWLREKRPDYAKALFAKNSVEEGESLRWKEIASSMAMPKTTLRGVIEQFDGFFNLKDVAIPKEERMKAPVSRLFEWDKINRMKLVKQADVLMLPFLFPDAFSKEVIAANYHYYEPLTDHGSSLSTSIHAAIAATVGSWEQAQDYWDKSLNFDLKNMMHNTPLGIHVACIGGTWQALIFHMLGIRLASNGPVIPQNPWLPKGCAEADFKLVYRGKRYPIRLRPQRKVAI